MADDETLTAPQSGMSAAVISLPASDLRQRLVIATHNPGKIAEMRELLAPYGIDDHIGG